MAISIVETEVPDALMPLLGRMVEVEADVKTVISRQDNVIRLFVSKVQCVVIR